MSDRIKLASLYLLAATALAACALVIYNAATNGWRLTEEVFEIPFLTSDDSAPELATATREWRFQMADTGTIALDGAGLALRLVPADGSEVTIDALLHGPPEDTGTYRTSATHQGTSVRVSIYPARKPPAGVRVAEVRIGIPYGCRVDLKLANSDVHASTLTVHLNAHLLGGNLLLRRVDGTLDADVTSGSVRLEWCQGGGAITVRDGRAKLEYNSGRYRLAASAGVVVAGHNGSLQVESSAGDATVELSGLLDESSIHAAGSVVFRAPIDARLTIDAMASAGILNRDLPLDSATTSPGTLQSGMNGGGYNVKLRSDAGTILLERSGEEEARSEE